VAISEDVSIVHVLVTLPFWQLGSFGRFSLVTCQAATITRIPQPRPEFALSWVKMTPVESVVPEPRSAPTFGAPGPSFQRLETWLELAPPKVAPALP
jgi:hypothetical protein